MASNREENEGKYSEAIPLAERVLAIRKQILGEEHPDVAGSLNNLAALYKSQGRYADAEPLYRQALSMKKRLLGQEHPDVANSLNSLAELYNSQGRYADAEPLFRQALSMRKRLLGQEHPDVATSLNNLAALYESQGRYADAEPLFRQALSMRKRLLGQEHPDVATSLNNLAALYESQGRYADAEPLFRQALSMRKRLLGQEHPDVATSLNNLAALYESQGRYADAEPLFRQALSMRKRLLGQEHPDVATSLNNLAALYNSQGRYADAEPLYRQALSMNKRLLGQEHPDVATSLNNLAALYNSQGRYADAEPLYRQALSMNKRLLGEEHPDVATSLNNLAALYNSQGRYADAEPLFRQALSMKKRLLGEEHPSVATSLNNLAALYWGQGDINRTLEFFTQGLKVEEHNLTLNLAVGFERQKRDYINTISATTYSSISLHLNSATKNPTATTLALNTVLQRKGRILDVLTNNQQILRQRLDPESQTLLTNLTNTQSQLAHLFYNRPETLPLEQYRTQVFQLETKIKQLEDQLSRRSEEFRTQSQPVTIETIQKLIPGDAALVELVQYQPFNPKAAPDKRFGKPRYAVYILSAKGETKGIDLGDTETIQKTIELFRDDLRDRGTDITQVKQSARNLDKILMQPVRKLLGNTRKILLSPDSALNLIPFEALVDENNRYLVENYSFTYLTSGRDLLRLQNHSPSQQPPVIIADPDFNKPGEIVARQPNANSIDAKNTRSIDLSQRTFSPLPATAKEAEAISILLKVKLLTGVKATEGAVKQVKSPRILHIATHGFFENAPANKEKTTLDDNPLLLSGLVFAGLKPRQSGGEDGILTALETTALNLVGTKLVVLSACDTGLGNISAGEGIYGLRRALVIAGSESQMISLWKVDDDATKELMVAYYKKLLDNQGRSEALRQTQLEMLKGEKYQHPYFWAAFIPSGDWKPMGK
ncbi:tetratricopeptide repeat protein [Nostoc sp. FACHB-110]|uniref:tetratricopeptide repeat protein n=1 Tax=Nostoc sp. FACHB-110 TaxID=2692834 RepID=UPI0037C5D050